MPTNTTDPNISVDRGEHGVAILSLRGEIETFHAPKLDRELSALLLDGVGVVVDLSGTEFLDSAVMTALLRARDEAREQGLPFALVIDDSTGWAVRRLFEITGLDGVFPIAATPREALAAAS